MRLSAAMKGSKKLKIANRKNADLECRPHDEIIEISNDKQTAYFAALVEAWLQTRMEKDKSLLMLAAGGVGVLVTLLTTTGIHSPFVGSLFAGIDLLLNVNPISNLDIRTQR